MGDAGAVSLPSNSLSLSPRLMIPASAARNSDGDEYKKPKTEAFEFMIFENCLIMLIPQMGSAAERTIIVSDTPGFFFFLAGSGLPEKLAL